MKTVILVLGIQKTEECVKRSLKNCNLVLVYDYDCEDMNAKLSFSFGYCEECTAELLCCSSLFELLYFTVELL
jgi:hypothetical protein